MNQATAKLFNLHRCLGEMEACVSELATRIELLEREAWNAPTRAMMEAAQARGESYMFHAKCREAIHAEAKTWRGHIAKNFSLINDLRAELFPERHEWTRMLSLEAKRAIAEANFEQLRSMSNREGSRMEAFHAVVMPS